MLYMMKSKPKFNIDRDGIDRRKAIRDAVLKRLGIFQYKPLTYHCADVACNIIELEREFGVVIWNGNDTIHDFINKVHDLNGIINEFETKIQTKSESK